VRCWRFGVFALLLVALCKASSPTLSTYQGPARAPTLAVPFVVQSAKRDHELHARAPFSITQSLSQAITPLNSVSCNAGGLHAANSYLRAFQLGALGPYTVTNIEFGIEGAVGAGGVQPATINLYSSPVLPGPTFTIASLTLLSTTNIAIPDQAQTVTSGPVTPAVLPSNSVLVVEIFTPNGQVAGHSFFIGSNSAGETGPSYLAAADCGIANPTSIALVGFPNMQIVLNVLGQQAGPIPTE